MKLIEGIVPGYVFEDGSDHIDSFIVCDLDTNQYLCFDSKLEYDKKRNELGWNHKKTEGSALFQRVSIHLILKNTKLGELIL